MQIDYSVFTWDVFLQFIKNGLIFSVQLTVIATLGGILVGTLLALLRLSKFKFLAWFAKSYVNVMRSIPLPMVLLWFFLVFPMLVGHSIGAEQSAMITFIAFEAAYFSEIVRAGIQSIPVGQVNAGKALGLSYFQNLKLIVLPQAFINMIPVFVTQTIILFQDTSMVYVIGAYDLLKGFELVGKNHGRPIEAYLMAALVYFIICFALSQLLKQYQKKQAYLSGRI